MRLRRSQTALSQACHLNCSGINGQMVGVECTIGPCTAGSTAWRVSSYTGRLIELSANKAQPIRKLLILSLKSTCCNKELSLKRANFFISRSENTAGCILPLDQSLTPVTISTERTCLGAFRTQYNETPTWLRSEEMTG
jgi:hypothetical protein